MRITEDKVKDLAKLARLQFEGEELTKMQMDLENILVMCEKLNGLDTEGKEPLIYMGNQHTTLRKDEIVQEITKDDALKNAPKKDSDFFRVPKVIDGNE
jgi:aspartyl-tRNA(Asn)/glutamyl-tRNA(Gln) amidotransferase subunit C